MFLEVAKFFSRHHFYLCVEEIMAFTIDILPKEWSGFANPKRQSIHIRFRPTSFLPSSLSLIHI